jgi:hypothetical protein
MFNGEINPNSREYTKKMPPGRKYAEKEDENKEMGFLERIQEEAMKKIQLKNPNLTLGREQEIKLIFSQIVTQKKPSWDDVLANVDFEDVEKTELNLANGLAIETLEKLRSLSH